MNDQEAFCGAWSLKNPNIIFMDSFMKGPGQIYGEVPLQLYPRVRPDPGPVNWTLSVKKRIPL